MSSDGGAGRAGELNGMPPAGSRIAYGGIVMALCLAIGSVGAAPRPVDPRPDPDACRLLTDLDLEPLLFAGSGGRLDSRRDHPAPGLSTCRWKAYPSDHAADVVPRTVTLGYYHIADRLRAQSQLDRQPHRDARPSQAITGKGDDAIARPSPTLVLARHGADLAMLDAGGAELDNPDQPEARYLLDALALKAAGAAVKPPPWAKPGQTAAWTPAGAPGSAGGWSPPPRAVPAGAGLIEPLIHGLKVLADLRYMLMAVAAPLVSVLIIFGSGRARAGQPSDPVEPATRRRRRWPVWVGGASLALLIADNLFGAGVANALIDRYGEAGAATVTGSFATATQYNRRDVIGYDVMIGTADRRVVAGQFRTDDFNVRGIGDGAVYPGVGDIFTVRYLAHHPGDFIIRNDDQSPWARKLACARLARWRGEAARRAGFVPDDARLRSELGRAEAADHDAGCPN